MLFRPPLRRCLQLVGLTLWLCALHRPALAQDHITERAWMEDTTGQMSWQAAQAQPFQNFSGVLSKGFGHSVIWLRLRIDPHAHPTARRDPDRLVLRIRPVYLDDINVYDPLAPQAFAGSTGDQHHPRADEFQGLDFLLPIARGTEARDIYIRLASSSTRQIFVQALNMRDLSEVSQRQQIMFAIYIGLILCLALWALAHWLFSREGVIGAFGLHQLTALFFAFNSLGYARALWPAQWSAWALDLSTSIFSMVAVSCAMVFHILLIREFSPRRWMVRIFWLMPLLLLVKITLLLTGGATVALQMNMFEVLISPFIFLLAVLTSQGWSAAHTGPKPALARAAVIGLYLLLVLILMVAALPGLGWTEGDEVPLYVVQAHGLVTAFLVLLLLQYRAHVMQKQQRSTALALERSLLQTQQERTVREEQEKLLTMLAHELKTPLATMHMRLDSSANGTHEIKQAIRDMTGVIDRCVQMTQLGDHRLVAHPEICQLTDLLRDAVSACAQPDRVVLDMPAQLTVRTDRQLLFIVLNNLLENACKYALPDSPIHVALQSDAHQPFVRLTVRNLPRPKGWPDPALVFDKYYRSPQAQRQAGTGLGLFLVHNLMQTLGGHIRYEPDDTWVRFVVELPAGA